MSVEINGKTYRNLPEQVEKNKDDIEKLKNYYPFSGPYATTDDIPEDILIDTGKYLIGSNEPYSIYQYDEKDEYFIDLGTFADPTNYINKKGNVTGITGKKIFNYGSGQYAKTITLLKDNNSTIELEGGSYNTYNQTKPKLVINSNYMHMLGAASNTSYTDASTTIGNGEIAINAPNPTGDELILNTYGGTSCNFVINTRDGQGSTGAPYVHINKYELQFTPQYNDYDVDYKTTNYSYGGIIHVNRQNASSAFTITTSNITDRGGYRFPFITEYKTVATIDDIKVPDAPTVDGTYTLKVTVSDGTPTYSWVLEN